MKLGLLLLFSTILLVGCNDKKDQPNEAISPSVVEKSPDTNEKELITEKKVETNDSLPKTLTTEPMKNINIVDQFLRFNPQFDLTKIGDQVILTEETKISMASEILQRRTKLITQTVIEITQEENGIKIYKILVKELEAGKGKKSKTFIQFCRSDDFYNELKKRNTQLTTSNSYKDIITQSFESEKAITKKMIEMDNHVCLKGTMSSVTEVQTAMGLEKTYIYNHHVQYSKVDISELDLESI
jgi:hypothetical protein